MTISESTIEKIKACKQAEFPLCFEESLRRMFGAEGRKRIDLIAKKTGLLDFFPIQSAEDIWALYERYLRAISKTFGEDVGNVVDFQAYCEMDSMGCQSCPLYGLVRARQKSQK